LLVDVLVRVGDVGESVVLNAGSVAGFVTHQWAGILGIAFDDVVVNGDGRKIHDFGIETEESIFAGQGVGDDVVVVELEVVVAAVGPEETATRVLDQIVVEDGWARGENFAEFRDKVAAVIFGRKIKEVFIHFHMIAGELDGIGFGDPVVVDMEAGFDAGLAAFVFG